MRCDVHVTEGKSAEGDERGRVSSNVAGDVFHCFLHYHRCMRSLRGLTSTSRQRNRVWHTTSTHAGGRKSPMEHGKRQEPDFEQPYDPFGERAFFKTDYWEANFYDEPDNTPVELYVESM